VILAYMAHPISGDVPANVMRAKRWLAWLSRRYPDRAFVAPYIDWIEAGDEDGDPDQRERGLQRCCSVAARCEEFWAVGGRLSAGMNREVEAWRNTERLRRLLDRYHCEHLSDLEPPDERRLSHDWGRE
jgi:hypothetical protein